jgi:hypothetical protein
MNGAAQMEKLSNWVSGVLSVMRFPKAGKPLGSPKMPVEVAPSQSAKLPMMVAHASDDTPGRRLPAKSTTSVKTIFERNLVMGYPF